MTRLLVCCLALAALCPIAAAQGRRYGPGETLELTKDLIISREGSLELVGTAEKPCKVVGNGRKIRCCPVWTGKLIMRHCEVTGLGTETVPSLDLNPKGDGDCVIIENCTFDACGAIRIHNEKESATVFRNNTVRDTSLTPVTNLVGDSPPAIRISGPSKSRKLFQGNRIYKSIIEFSNTANWLIGGDSDADANIIIGQRASLSIHRSSDMTVRGNYIHTEILDFKWSQVHTLSVLSPCPNLVVEHNVIRHGQWVIRGITGEFRYNLVLDADAHNWIIGPREKTRIHHNIFARYCTIDPNLNAGIGVIYKDVDLHVFNNTFDGGGKGMARIWHVPAIEVSAESFLASLRNNVFYEFPTKFHNGSATIRPGFFEKKSEPAPARLGYADYNLFFNKDAAEIDNYAVSVAGKAERKEAGFGLNDIPRGGAKDEQVDPKFAGPVPRKFPFSDEDIKSGKVGVSDILAKYRELFSPAAGSPLINAGDPADGEGSFIGAVGPAGKKIAGDQFGRFGKKAEGRP